MPDPHDWESDPRPLADCLKDWARRQNRGSVYGARQRAVDELRVNPANLANWLEGKPCSWEPSLRRLMTLIDHMHERAGIAN